MTTAPLETPVSVTLPAPITTQTSGGERLVFLEGLRGVLAIMVILGHWAVFALPETPLTNLLYIGFRVPAFFALSGFVLYLSSASLPELRLKTPFWEYVRRRVFRLVPAYWGVLTVASIVLLFLSSRGNEIAEKLMHRPPLNIGTHYLFLHTWYPDYLIQHGILDAAWMMGYEWQLSLMLPLFLIVGRYIGWAGLILFFVFLFTPWGHAMNTMTKSEFFSPSLSLSFVLGMAAVRLVRHSKLREKHATLRPVTLAVSLVALAIHLGLAFTKSDLHTVQAFAGLMMASLCAYMTLQPATAFNQALCWPPLLFIARISYSLFLVHHPIIMLTTPQQGIIQTGVGAIGQVLLTFALIVLATAASFMLFERPYLMKKEAAVAERKKAVPVA